MNATLESALKLVFSDARNRIQQNEWEFRTFINRVQDELKPERTVELGTWKGANAALLSLVSGKTVTVDYLTYDPLDVAVPSHELTKLIRDGHNPDTAKEVVEMLGGPLDLLFIDDGHRIEEVTSDYAVWSPYVRPGGWIVFHDINPDANQCAPGVHPDICQSHVHWAALTGRKQEIIEGGASPGIGIIIK